MARGMLSSWSVALWHAAVGKCRSYCRSSVGISRQLLNSLVDKASCVLGAPYGFMSHPTSKIVAYPLVNSLLPLLSVDPSHSLLCAQLRSVSPEGSMDDITLIIYCLSRIYSSKRRSSKQGCLLIQIALWRYFLKKPGNTKDFN